MEIKQLCIDDIEEIKALFRSVFMNEPWNDDWSDGEQLHQYITDLTGNRNSLSFGLYDGDELIGLSLGSVIHWWEGTEYYISEYCVARDRQGKGLGSLFLGEIEKRMKESGFDHIFLQTERGLPAYRFYTKNGFSEMTEHASLYKDFD